MATPSPDRLASPSRPMALMLVDFKERHKKLLLAMSDLDKLTRGPLPTKERVIDARWNISRASLARRTHWNLIYSQLLCRAPQGDAKELRRLRENDMVLLRFSSEHVGKWAILAVMEDWPGYCEASRAIRWKMQAAIGAEQRVLYPMIQAADVECW